jgi:hypothetical protein
MIRNYLIIAILFWAMSLFSQQSFQNVTTSMGISGQSGLGHAVCWGDIDNDGDPDLAFSNQEGDGFWLYRNDLDGFTDITAQAGLSGLGANKIIICELSGDDFNDLLIRTRSQTQKLFESNGDGTFTDISYSSGVANAAVYNVADFNNDGYTDLLSVAGSNYSILYNNGDGTFAPAEIIAPLPDFMGVAVFDYNNDGLIDLYGTTYGANPNQLLKNNGDGSFTDKTVEAGLVYNDRAHAVDVGDYDNDGYVDVYLGSYSGSRGELCKLFRNNGDGTFEDVSSTTSTQGHDDTRTTVFTDYNNDGWLDIFSSHHDFFSYSNTMQKSNQAVVFEEVGPSLGISGEWIGDYFGQAWADFNLDGAVDFFAAGHIDKYRLFKNNNCPGTSLSIKLKGVISNPNGIGARVEVKTTARAYSRFMLPDGGLHDFSELKLVFGIDGAYSVDSITVFWPSGITQQIGNTNAGENLLIVEDTLSTNISIHDTQQTNFKIFPNPAIDFVNISFYLSESNDIIISLLSFNGTHIKTLTNKNLNKGDNNVKVRISGLRPGVYILKLQSGNFIEIKKLIVQ